MSLCNNQWKCRSGRRRISPTPGTTVVIPETPEDGQRVNEQLLDGRLAALEEARAWSPRLISKLESHNRRRSGFVPDQRLQLCPERHLPENEIIDLFLHATALGLFAMDWSLHCPQSAGEMTNKPNRRHASGGLNWKIREGAYV
jgi:hypothetical protein